ncbi:MAG: ABC transporter ATP-binding protein [Erysipelotrichaceae bacterium]
MEKLIEFKNFTFKYDAQSEPTLYDINLSINKSEKILIIGPSGSGKSTLAHCINGLIPHTYKGEYSGNIYLYGNDVYHDSIFKRSKSVGTVLQDSDGQFVGLTVGEDIAFSLENDNCDQQIMYDKVLKVSSMVDMDKFLTKAPFNLSGGQKQRVALAGVMIDDVDLLLFDEPLANLDPATGKKAIALIDKLQKDYGKTIVIIEHRLEDVLYCDVDRIILMDDGHIIFDGTANDLLLSDLLNKYGIREPLYLTALKHSKMCSDTNVSNINDIHGQYPLLENFYDRYETEEKINKKEDVLLTLKNVSFSYDGKNEVLKDINFDLYKNEMISIVGKNGAGKSTIAKLILGFLPKYSGNMEFMGQDMKDMTIFERSNFFGLVLQNPNQMISKPMIYDEVALGLRNRKMDEETIREKVTNVLEICGLSPFIDWPVRTLSYGQKKRVTIASILVMEPKILILDEPTAGQDYRHYQEILEFLKKINQLGTTIMMITHDMHLMLEYSDRCLVLADGVLKADAYPYQVLTNKDLIDSANLKETSLFTLANHLKMNDSVKFVKNFISYERGIKGE